MRVYYGIEKQGDTLRVHWEKTMNQLWWWISQKPKAREYTTAYKAAKTMSRAINWVDIFGDEATGLKQAVTRDDIRAYYTAQHPHIVEERKQPVTRPTPPTPNNHPQETSVSVNEPIFLPRAAARTIWQQLMVLPPLQRERLKTLTRKAIETIPLSIPIDNPLYFTRLLNGITRYVESLDCTGLQEDFSTIRLPGLVEDLYKTLPTVETQEDKRQKIILVAYAMYYVDKLKGRFDRSKVMERPMFVYGSSEERDMWKQYYEDVVDHAYRAYLNRLFDEEEM